MKLVDLIAVKCSRCLTNQEHNNNQGPENIIFNGKTVEHLPNKYNLHYKYQAVPKAARKDEQFANVIPLLQGF